MKDISSIWTGAWEAELQLIALSRSLSFSSCWVQGLKATVVLQGFVFAAIQACTSMFNRGKHRLTPWCGEEGGVQSLTWLLTTGLSFSSGVAVGWSICGLMHGTGWLARWCPHSLCLSSMYILQVHAMAGPEDSKGDKPTRQHVYFCPQLTCLDKLWA